LFFGGLVLGFHRKDVVNFFAKIPALSRILEVTVLVAAGVFMWLFANNFSVWPELPNLLDLKNRWLMPPVQLALVALYLMAAFIIVSHLWGPLRAGLGWFLEPLGRSSLWAFTVHWFVFTALANLKTYMEYPYDRWWWQLLGVGFVWATIKLYGLVLPKKPKPDSSSADALKSRLSSVVSSTAGMLEPPAMIGHPDDLSARYVLGVSREASLSEIRGAYQTKVAQYHPDKLATLNTNLRKLAENEVRSIDTAYLKLIENLDIAEQPEPARTGSSTGLMLVMRNLYGRVRSQW
jgi:DnaJ domain/OpgC protein